MVVDALLGHQLPCDDRLSVEVARARSASQDQADCAAVDRPLTRRYVAQRSWVKSERLHAFWLGSTAQPRNQLGDILGGLIDYSERFHRLDRTRHTRTS